MLRRVALARTNASEERVASIIRVTRIHELETTLAVTSNRRTLRRNMALIRSVRRVCPSHHLRMETDQFPKRVFQYSGKWTKSIKAIHQSRNRSDSISITAVLRGSVPSNDIYDDVT
jgi:hypothetical protein